MAYEPTVWKTGDTITAEKLNKIEKGLGAELFKVEAEALFNGDLSETKTCLECADVLSIDKSVDEILAAIEAEKHVVLTLNFSEDGSFVRSPIQMEVSSVEKDSGHIAVGFAYYGNLNREGLLQPYYIANREVCRVDFPIAGFLAEKDENEESEDCTAFVGSGNIDFGGHLSAVVHVGGTTRGEANEVYSTGKASADVKWTNICSMINAGFTVYICLNPYICEKYNARASYQVISAVGYQNSSESSYSFYDKWAVLFATIGTTSGAHIVSMVADSAKSFPVLDLNDLM